MEKQSCWNSWSHFPALILSSFDFDYVRTENRFTEKQVLETLNLKRKFIEILPYHVVILRIIVSCQQFIVSDLSARRSFACLVQWEVIVTIRVSYASVSSNLLKIASCLKKCTYKESHFFVF